MLMERKPANRCIQLAGQDRQGLEQLPPVVVPQQGRGSPAQDQSLSPDPGSARQLPDRIRSHLHRQRRSPVTRSLQRTGIPPRCATAEGQDKSHHQTADGTPERAEPLSPEDHSAALQTCHHDQQQVVHQAADAGAVLQQAAPAKNKSPHAANASQHRAD